MAKARRRVGVLDFLRFVNWLDGAPLLPRIEPYRTRILSDVLDTPDAGGTGLRYNLALLGRSKKNFKSCDLVLAALFACLANDSVFGNEAYVIATDEGQARDEGRDCERDHAKHDAAGYLARMEPAQRGGRSTPR